VPHSFVENSATLLIEILVALGLLIYFYFRKRAGKLPESRTIQRIEIKLLGTFDPPEVHVRVGKPAQLLILRYDDEPKDELFEIEGVGIYEILPAHYTTIIAFTPERHGTYPMILGGERQAGLMIVE
jgi:plastocyanin domain-containing protein